MELPQLGALPSGLLPVETLWQGSRTLVLRCRTPDGGHAIVKTPAHEILDRPALARYRHELHLLRQVEGPGVVRALDLLERAGRPFLVLQDRGGRSLGHWLEAGRLTPREVVERLLQAARA